MSDIVKRLRGRQALVLGGRPYADLYRDAADEIERLRKLIDGAAETGEIYERRLSECEAENDALRSRLAEAEALRKDAKRYRWLRRGNYSIETARSILNDTPEGIDAAIDAAMEGQ